MSTATKQKENIALGRLISELTEIKLQLRKLVLLIPEESLREYENAKSIRAAYRRAESCLS